VYEQNRKKSRKALKIHKCSKEFIEYLVESIKQEKWSVDETISRAKKQRMFEIIPSYKTIYNYIEKGILQIKNIDLALKVKRKARNKIGIKNKKIYLKFVNYDRATYHSYSLRISWYYSYSDYVAIFPIMKSCTKYVRK